jgi:hypothetical protein
MAYHVKVGAPIELYAGALPAGALPVGVVRRDDGSAGALVRLRMGTYAQLNDHALCALNRREVLRAMIEGLSSR